MVQVINDENDYKVVRGKIMNPPTEWSSFSRQPVDVVQGEAGVTTQFPNVEELNDEGNKRINDKDNILR